MSTEILDDLTAAFQTQTPKPRFNAVYIGHDSCGFTAGWIGFCTSDNGVLSVVQAYTLVAPGNPLSAYSPLLGKLAGARSTDLHGLKGFDKAWQKAARDPAFQRVQIQVGHDLYLAPALTTAAREGIATPLGIENLYDTALSMGPSTTDCDGLPTIVAETDKAMNGNPASGDVTEASWLQRFAQIRTRHFLKPCVKKSFDKKEVSRIQALENLAAQGNWGLTPPIKLGKPYNVTVS